ncbi:unnamed protein product [Microthlaspi erraticum]|uniref:F-box associated beta-propeller type 3 domain-containing protein n=1 Tax=Microthlaspi erraticum TaxID=1685480 RepID=A0A6D2L535_9BRAS|nr:unnamed protein product [Microthlaspi erraticum]
MGCPRQGRLFVELQDFASTGCYYSLSFKTKDEHVPSLLTCIAILDMIVHDIGVPHCDCRFCVSRPPLSCGGVLEISWLGLFEFEETAYCNGENNLVLWVLEDAGNHKWSKQAYELPLFSRSRRKGFVGMTATGDIVLSLSGCNDGSKPYFVYFFNPERKTFAGVNIQEFDEEFENRNTIGIFLDYVENLKFM